MRLQSIVNTNDSLQISFLEEADIDTQTGIMEARVLDVPHAVIPQEHMDDLVDSVEQILEVARVARRRPVEQFVANR
jgi:hypothetical protein